ncbi:retroviral-like aspartic protease family protein [Parerythrobacter aestuarii]|uniref:retroviral-like aspartic protease family protein n=1 Tax=Parerythrobacter aestuarii TaxID=3020909 RepID=UPI0024DEFD4C|nr:retroviral-like aspartic protease family protein [Parerythrobacter aestuarii]
MLKRLIGVAALVVATPLLANSTAYFPQADDPAAKDEEALTPDLIQAQKDRYERLTVPVTIEGKGPYRFMVDTGAQATAISRNVSDELELPSLGTATLVAMGSRREVDMVQLNGLEFAGRLFDNLESPLLDARHVGADGILGLDSLQDMRVLIDFKEDRMLVADAGSLGGNKGYEIVVKARRRLGQMIITNARIDGVKTAVIIDTGAQNTVGNRALQQKLRSRAETQVLSTDVNGVQVIGNLGFVRKLKIEGMELTNVPISFADSPAFAALGLEDQPTIIMGMRNLQNFERIAIDFSSRRILFDLPAGSYNVNPYERVFFPSRVGN